MKSSMWEPRDVWSSHQAFVKVMKAVESIAETSEYFMGVTSLFSCWKYEKAGTPFFASFFIPQMVSSVLVLLLVNTVLSRCMIYREEAEVTQNLLESL